ncbi:hypothetical protein AMTRI_Chr08g168820 [Amborella trichopoda]
MAEEADLPQNGSTPVNGDDHSTEARAEAPQSLDMDIEPDLSENPHPSEKNGEEGNKDDKSMEPSTLTSKRTRDGEGEAAEENGASKKQKAEKSVEEERLEKSMTEEKEEEGDGGGEREENEKEEEGDGGGEREENEKEEEGDGGGEREENEKEEEVDARETEEGDEGVIKATDENNNQKVSGPVSLGPKGFSTSVEMFDYFYKFITFWPPHVDFNKYEHMVLMDLIKRGHPDPDKKIGNGIRAFQVRYHPLWKSKCYFIVRDDGLADDFSYRKCVDKILPLPENMKAKTDIDRALEEKKNHGGGGGRGGRGRGHSGHFGRGGRSFRK